jgi:hypothetical protein
MGAVPHTLYVSKVEGRCYYCKDPAVKVTSGQYAGLYAIVPHYNEYAQKHIWGHVSCSQRSNYGRRVTINIYADVSKKPAAP